MHPMTDFHWQLPDPERDAEFYADVPLKRAFAWVIDAAVILGITLLAIPLTFFAALFFLPLLWLVLSFAYRVVTLARGSATWGMRFMGIELRTHRGERFDLPEAFMHTLVYSVCMAFVLPQVVSAVLMLTTARGQGLPDLAVGSTALNRRR